MKTEQVCNAFYPVAAADAYYYYYAVSCIMMQGLMYRMFLDKLKKEVGSFF